MTYLIIRLATIGNVAMTVPVIASLSRRYPNDRFVIASKKNLRAMFDSFENVEFAEVDNHLDWKGVWDFWREWRNKVDAVIDLQSVLRTKQETCDTSTLRANPKAPDNSMGNRHQAPPAIGVRALRRYLPSRRPTNRRRVHIPACQQDCRQESATTRRQKRKRRTMDWSGAFCQITIEHVALPRDQRHH